MSEQISPAVEDGPYPPVPALPLQEAMSMVQLPPAGAARRYMSRRAAYLPGSDFTAEAEMPAFHRAAFGGHVYAQSALAATRAWREVEDEKGVKKQERLDLHTINGFFTRPGIPSRPFLYTATPLASSRTFSTVSVIAHQPSQPSGSPSGDNYPLSDASLPLSPPSFVAICSFKRPEPDSHGASAQETPVQERFAEILSSRPPEDWPPAPPVDITGVVEMVGADQEGQFPIALMRKVDMTAYNADRPVWERVELILYKLRRPVTLQERGKEWDANAHIAAHAYVADRNGLLVVGNHVGFGHSLGRAATLSYTFVVHVNAEEAVMREEEGWWVQEMRFPRVGRGRGIVESKIWSPRGVHVATEYQDGLIQGLPGGGWPKREREEARL
ncbi:hypothetical protein VTJ49DRAFT_4032 [Mycothermus thermophilus]|uniref:Thioesterase/thiol ester dehydrase-isomerase n=1 Tax=Humicola insolens TaxID=85995 RepID=A0ABR3V6Q7_HUMIN